MKLSVKQAKFTHMIALLILHAEQFGFKLTFGDAHRDKRCGYGHKDSLHKLRLAVDFNLFIDGEYIKDQRGHDELHAYFESIGGSSMIWEDPCHYSLEHNGMR